MGLNWGAGLKAAGQGVGQMAGIKMKEADYIYKDVSQQNRERFSAGESQKQRDFLSAEKETQREWEEPFKTKALEISERGTELSGELKILGQQSLDTQRSIENQLRQQSNNITQQRADQAGQAEQAEQIRRNAEQRLKVYESEMDQINKEIEALESKTGSILIDPEDAQHKSNLQDLQQLEMQRDLTQQQHSWDQEVVKLGPEKEAGYDEAREFFGSSNQKTHDLSMKWAKMTPEQQSQVPTIADEMIKGHPQKESSPSAARSQAYGAAIDKVYGNKGLGKTPQASTQAAPLSDGAAEEGVSEVSQIKEEDANSEKEFVPRKNTGRRGEVAVAQHRASKTDGQVAKEAWVKKRGLEIAKEKGWTMGWTGDYVTKTSAKFKEAMALATKEWEEKESVGSADRIATAQK